MTSNPSRIVIIVTRLWKAVVYNKVTETDQPKWKDFADKYLSFVKRHEDAPTRAPDAKGLFRQAQRADYGSVAAQDGVRPAELRSLPLVAWEQRVRVLDLAIELRTWPLMYRPLYCPAIPKDGSPTPLNARVLSIFQLFILWKLGHGTLFLKIGC